MYVWVRRAFGRFPAALTSLLYWAGTPMWLGGSIAVIAMSVYERFVGDLSRPGMYLFGGVFVAVATTGAVIPLRWGKWLPTSGAIGQMVLLSFFTVTVVLYGVRHGVHGIGVGDLAPSTAGFIAVVPILLYSFVGIELPTTAAEEMRDPRRDIPAAIARAGVGQALMYGVPILAVLIVLPVGQITSLTGLVDAMKTVFTVYGGSVDAGGAATLTGGGRALGAVAAWLFIWVLAASGAAWIIGAGRAQAAACNDGAGPQVFGRTSPRTGTPVAIGLASGAAALAVMATSLAITGGDGQKYFSATLTTSVSFIVLAYLLIYPSFIALRRRRPDLPRPFRVPGGAAGAWLATALSLGWSALAVACLLYPGIGTSDPDGHLPAGFEGERLHFELLVIAPIVCVVTAAAGYVALARRREDDRFRTSG